MAYSGTQTFNLSIDEIIEEALERCQLEARSGYDLKTAKRSLNLMFAEWANREGKEADVPGTNRHLWLPQG